MGFMAIELCELTKYNQTNKLNISTNKFAFNIKF